VCGGAGEDSLREKMMLGIIVLCILFIYSLFQPYTAAIVYFLFIFLFEGYIFLTYKIPKNNWDHTLFSDQEILILNRYKLFFLYPFASKSFSSLLSGIQLSAFLWVPWLVYNKIWLFALFIGLNYFIGAKLSVKLNPILFLHDAVEKKGQKEYAEEMQIVDLISKKLLERHKESLLKNKKPRKRILLIENNAFLQDIYKEILELDGYSISIAIDGEEGVRKAIMEDYDLIITAMLLPKLDGIQIIQRIRKIYRLANIPILVLSNLSDELVIKKALSTGASKYLIKASVSPEEIIKEVRKYI